MLTSKSTLALLDNDQIENLLKVSLDAFLKSVRQQLSCYMLY